MSGLQVTYTNNFGQLKAAMQAKALRGLQRAVVHLHGACREVVSKPFPPASQRGEPPRLRTGFGKSNIVFTIDAATMTGRVGVRRNAAYMAILQVKYGRDWLFSTFKKERGQMARLFRSEFQT